MLSYNLPSFITRILRAFVRSVATMRKSFKQSPIEHSMIFQLSYTFILQRMICLFWFIELKVFSEAYCCLYVFNLRDAYQTNFAVDTFTILNKVLFQDCSINTFKSKHINKRNIKTGLSNFLRHRIFFGAIVLQTYISRRAIPMCPLSLTSIIKSASHRQYADILANQ